MNIKHSIERAYSGRIGDKVRDAMPRFRKRTTSTQKGGDFVYAHPFLDDRPEWLVICPQDGYCGQMDDALFGETYVASNEEAREIAAKIAKRRPAYKAAYYVNQPPQRRAT